jgi:hypothetical protein
MLTPARCNTHHGQSSTYPVTSFKCQNGRIVFSPSCSLISLSTLVVHRYRHANISSLVIVGKNADFCGCEENATTLVMIARIDIAKRTFISRPFLPLGFLRDAISAHVPSVTGVRTSNRPAARSNRGRHGKLKSSSGRASQSEAECGQQGNTFKVFYSLACRV